MNGEPLISTAKKKKTLYSKRKHKKVGGGVPLVGLAHCGVGVEGGTARTRPGV